MHKLYIELDGILVGSENDFSRIEHDPEWYPQLKITENGQKLWDFCKILNPTILTKVPMEYRIIAAYGKRTWVDRNLGEEVDMVALPQEDKLRFCTEGDILIDTDPEILTKWAKEGNGIALLWDDNPDLIGINLATIFVTGE